MAHCGVHPISTALFLLGYGLALPIAAKMPAIIAGQQRLAFWAHQFGLIIAIGGWLFRGQFLVIAGHVIWFVIVNLWYRFGGRRQRNPNTRPAST